MVTWPTAIPRSARSSRRRGKTARNAGTGHPAAQVAHGWALPHHQLRQAAGCDAGNGRYSTPKACRLCDRARVRRASEGGYGDDDVRAITLLEVEGRTTNHVIKLLRGLPEVQALNKTNEGWDPVAEIRPPPSVYFDRILSQIRTVDGVLNSESSLLLNSVLRYGGQEGQEQ